MMFKVAVPLLVLVFAPVCPAQTTCTTDPQGTTLCSTPDGVISGTTSSSGDSIYRDNRGHLLEYDVDRFGNATIQLPGGDAIRWSQPQPTGGDIVPRAPGPPPVSQPPAVPWDIAAPTPGPRQNSR